MVISPPIAASQALISSFYTHRERGKQLWKGYRGTVYGLFWKKEV